MKKLESIYWSASHITMKANRTTVALENCMDLAFSRKDNIKFDNTGHFTRR